MALSAAVIDHNKRAIEALGKHRQILAETAVRIAGIGDPDHEQERQFGDEQHLRCGARAAVGGEGWDRAGHNDEQNKNAWIWQRDSSAVCRGRVYCGKSVTRAHRLICKGPNARGR
jgi:hypothetical protein